MLAADAGFVATAALAPDGQENCFETNSDDRSRHVGRARDGDPADVRDRHAVA